MKKKINVVEFFGEPLNYGGQEAFIINMYNNFSNNFKITFITPFEATNENLKNIIKDKKDYLINDNQKFDTFFRKVNIIRTAKKHLNNKYDVVHIHSGSLFTLYNVAKIAKNKGIKKVVVHSHIVSANNIKNKIIKYLTKDIEKYVDYFLACTELAGESKFPKSIIKSDKYSVINNGINIDKFSFNKKIRDKYRKEFNLSDKTVLINVARFNKEKNHLFLIELFNRYLKVNKNAFLILVGGEAKELNNIRQLIFKYKLTEKVKILTNRNDVNNLLFMSDIFILPSLWEGLPVTGIEAQTTGMPCIFSTNITEKINVTKVFYKMDLDENYNEWIKLLEKVKNKNRINTINQIRQAGYDVKISAKKLEKIYYE